MHREAPSWREFASLVTGLLAMKSRLWQAVTPTPDKTTEPSNEGVTTYD